MTATVTPDPVPEDPRTTPPHVPRREVGVTFESRRGVLVLRPTGRLDRSTAERLRRDAASATGPVVVDLDDCVLVDPTAIDAIDVDGDGDGDLEVCIVCRRLSCRRLLARVGVTDRFAVFQRLEDALQARVLANAGYGPGWSGR